MADLRKLFPKKESNNGPEPVAQSAPNANGVKPNPFARVTSGSASSTQSGSQQRAVAPTEGTPAPAGSNGDTGRTNPKLANIFGGTRRVGGAADSSADAAISGNGLGAGVSGSGNADSDSAGDAGVSGDGLDFLNSLAADVEPVRDSGPKLSSFPDETPATAPTRELPDDLDKSAISFVELIDQVYGIIHDTELLSNVIRNIMVELKANPQYIKLVVKDDVRTWVRAMRDGMGLARIKKQEKKSGSGRRSSSKAAENADLAKAFDELGINLDDL